MKISNEQLQRWIELARFSASARNMQPLKYVLCNSREINEKIFTTLGWAGYLNDWLGPDAHERPVAYIVVLHDKSLANNYFCDDGIAVQSILLGAVDDGFGGCIIGTVNKNNLAKLLKLTESLATLWVLALGKPDETVVLHDVQGEDIKYWRDENQVHHVPKRALLDLIYSSY